jgi:hypothetical protein
MASGVIAFSGYRWSVRQSKDRVGPGPNFFGDQGVQVDAEGRLHLAIVRKKAGWFCSEVVLNRSLGYGEYRFAVRNKVLDANSVFGMFLWDARAPRLHFREFDIELSRWGDPRKANAQFAVQPYRRAGNLVRFELAEGLAELLFKWSPGRLVCRAVARGSLVKEHLFARGVPTPGKEHIHMNLWLYRGAPPASGKPASVVVERFGFVSAGAGISRTLT